MFRMVEVRRWLALATILVLLAACGTSDTASTPGATDDATANGSPAASEQAVAGETAGNGTIQAVATTSIIGDLVQNVGGDRVSVTTMLPPGTDPHTYSPTPSDVQAVANAQILFENGVGLEEWLEELIANAGGERTVVTVSEGLEPIEGFEHEEHGDEHGDEAHGSEEAHSEEEGHSEEDAHGSEEAHSEEEGHSDEGAHGDEHGHEEGLDPHMWLDVQNVISYVETIRDGLTSVDPDGAATYEANAAAYIEQLQQLDAEIEEQLATIPDDRRVLITNHDTFGYFAQRYGFEVAGTVFEGVSTEEEPSAQQIAQLVERIRSENVPAVFTENTVNPRLAEQVADEAGVEVVTTLYTDALGEPGSDGDTYIKMMRHNVAQIVAALGES